MTRSLASRKKTSPKPRFVHINQHCRSRLTYRQRNNETILQELVEKCDGTYGTAAAAIDYLSTPEVKVTRPFKSWYGKLSLGDWKTYEETALYIDVVRYFKTKRRTPPSASNFVTRTTNGATSGQSSRTIGEDAGMEDAPVASGDLAPVKMERKYKVKVFGDQLDDVPIDNEGKREVTHEELAKGYEYGRTAVPISESEENVTRLETLMEFTIIGFIPWDKV